MSFSIYFLNLFLLLIFLTNYSDLLQFTPTHSYTHLFSRSEDDLSRLYPVESVIVALPGAAVYTSPDGAVMKRLVKDKMEGERKEME